MEGEGSDLLGGPEKRERGLEGRVLRREGERWKEKKVSSTTFDFRSPSSGLPSPPRLFQTKKLI